MAVAMAAADLQWMIDDYEMRQREMNGELDLGGAVQLHSHRPHQRYGIPALHACMICAALIFLVEGSVDSGRVSYKKRNV